MQINLYKHNQTAYENALILLQAEKKAAVIHPTGTGKSFIAFKLCEDNSDKNICWLSPSEYIFDTQLENLKRTTGGYVPQNIRFFTYAKLMNMADSEISEINPDYIILDEFHRCGAEMWGQGVGALLSAYPDVPILGLSATAIRYLDNQRNMADELFDGNIASEMSLGEAIVRGILAPPKYVVSAFSCQKNLDKYKKRVSSAKNKAVRDEGEKYLDALKRALDKADGVDEIFDKHMTDRTGKYIVFCADYERMCQMKELANDWFYKIDKNPHIYSLYSEDPSSDTEFQEFKSDNDNTHLRLLYCIDALNEGVHVDDISGVFLLRPTVSPIIYKQQIGRALQTGITKSSVIFDIVMNIENLYSIGTIEEEMQLAISYYRSHGLEKDIVNEHFRVIDEVKDCLSLFYKLNETLTASWDYMYLEAKKYYDRHGNLEIPKRYKTENGYSLGTWLLTQKRVYSGAVGGTLTKERINKLNSIGMVWESQRDISWQKHFDAAKKYSQKHGNLSVPALYVTEDGIKLGTWIANLRTARKNGFNRKYISDDRIKALDEIGMIWEVSDYLWQRYYGACLTYYGLNGNLDIPCRYVTGDGEKLGAWLCKIRTAHKKGESRLTDEQVSALDELGMVWNKRTEQAWNKAYNAAKAYFEMYGNLNVPTTYKTADGFVLSKWVDRQRQNKELSESRKSKLDDIGMVWEKENSWDTRFKLAKAYFEKNGNLDMSTNYVTDGVWLGKWISEQRKAHKNGKLPAEQMHLLESLNIDWNTDIQKKYDEIWSGYFEEVKAYFDKNGDISGIGNSEEKDKQKLNIWIKKQRRYYKDGNLSKEKIKKLESVGIVWNPYVNAWETGFIHAKKYYEINGNLNIPASYIDDSGYTLGIWITNQRYNYRHPSRNKKITESQKKRLDGIGMVWDPVVKQWEKLYKSAEIYFNEHGNLNVPAKYKTADGYSLKEWLRTQRNNRVKGTLSNDKIERLDKIGMDWLSPAARNWETYFSACEKYYNTYGNLKIGSTYTDENGLLVGRWLKKQRINKAKLKTSGENGNQIERLESIGMVWEESNFFDNVTNADKHITQNDELRSYAV